MEGRWYYVGVDSGQRQDPTVIAAVELLQKARFKCELTPVLITGGEHEGRSDDGMALVPKRDLVAGLQVTFRLPRVSPRGEPDCGCRLRLCVGVRGVGAPGAALVVGLRSYDFYAVLRTYVHEVAGVEIMSKFSRRFHFCSAKSWC